MLQKRVGLANDPIDFMVEIIYNCSEGKNRHKDWILPPQDTSKVKFPVEFSLRDKTRPVMDQGNVGACVGYSGAVVAGCKAMNQDILIDPLHLYKTAQKYDRWEGEDYEGTSIGGACEALRLIGAKPEGKLHYVPRKIYAYYKMDWSRTEEMKMIIMSGQPIWASIQVYRWFWGANKVTGVIDHVSILERGEILGGHAIAVIGWTYIDGKLHWEIQNSWGEHYGDGGHAFIPHSMMKRCTKRRPGYMLVTNNDHAKVLRRQYKEMDLWQKIKFKIKKFWKTLRGKL